MSDPAIQPETLDWSERRKREIDDPNGLDPFADLTGPVPSTVELRDTILKGFEGGANAAVVSSACLQLSLLNAYRRSAVAAKQGRKELIEAGDKFKEHSAEAHDYILQTTVYAVQQGLV